MNRQDAKEIESLEKVVIGASIGYEWQESTGLAGTRPKKARSSSALKRKRTQRSGTRTRTRTRTR
jgi:hypothetical protein